MEEEIANLTVVAGSGLPVPTILARTSPAQLPAVCHRC